MKKFRPRFFLFSAFLLLINGLAARPDPSRPWKQVDMPGYTVISDADDTKLRAWVREFDEFRRAGQEILGLNDGQLLPLTVIIFAETEDYGWLLNRPGPYGLPHYSVYGVGLDQQPTLALSMERFDYTMREKIRSGGALWLLGSTGVGYDRWVLSGLTGLFSTLKTEGDEVLVGETKDDSLGIMRKAGWHPTTGLMQGVHNLDQQLRAWLLVHYLTLREKSWRGLEQFDDYQRLIEEGTHRWEAFEQAFGFSVREADIRLTKYLRSGPVRPIRLTGFNISPEPKITIRAAEAGLREISFAQYMLQNTVNNLEEALGFIRQAESQMPDDPRIAENLWRYGVRRGEEGMAREALSQAIAQGSKNHYLRLFWCESQAADAFSNAGSFIIDNAVAGQIRDELERLVAQHRNMRQPAQLLARLTAALKPPAEQDRLALEAALAKRGGRNPLIEVGLAAWDWRSGNAEAAETRLAMSAPDRARDGLAKTYGDWLELQLRVDRGFRAVQAAIDRNDIPAAQSLVRKLERLPFQNPEAQQRLFALKTELSYDEVLGQVEDFLNRNMPDYAWLLLERLGSDDLPPRLRPKVEALVRDSQKKHQP